MPRCQQLPFAQRHVGKLGHTGTRQLLDEANRRVGTIDEVVRSMRTLLAVTFVAACGSSAEPQTGAFDPDDAVKATDAEARISVHRREVPLAEMSMGRWLLGIPMRGMAEVDIELTAPIEKGDILHSRSRGTITMGCATGCTLGDDTAKIAIEPDMQLPFGHLDFEKLELAMVVEDGHAKVTSWTLASPDVRVTLDLDIALADDFSQSTIDGCVRFAPTKSLLERDPKTHAVLSTTGANRVGDTFSIKVAGTVGATKRLAQSCGGQTGAVD